MFLELPEGLVVDRDVIALRLRKSMYGLKPASRNWYLKLHDALTKLGFTSFLPDQCVFIYRDTNEIAVLAVYVDDCLLVSSNSDLRQSIVQLLGNIFEIKVMSEPRLFVGLELRRYEQAFVISQKQYLTKLARKFGVTDPQFTKTPMDTKLHIVRDLQGGEYPGLRALVGGLLYMTRCSRPDVYLAVNKVSRVLNYANEQIYCHALRILSYLQATKDYVLVFRSSDKRSVYAFVDASFADSREDQYQSTGGYLIFANGDLVAWACKKHQTTDNSTSMAEYTALNVALREIMFVKALSEDIEGISEPAIIYEDNSSTLAIANGTETSLSRFLLTKHFAIRQAVQAGEVIIEKVSTVDQLADIMTKALDKAKFETIRSFLLECVDFDDYINANFPEQK